MPLVVGGAISSSKEDMEMHSRSTSPGMSKIQSHDESDNMKIKKKLPKSNKFQKLTGGIYGRSHRQIGCMVSRQRVQLSDLLYGS